MTQQPAAQVSAADHEAAAAMAEEAGRLLLGVRARGLTGDALKKAGDAESHTFLMAALSQRFPDDAVLSEEGSQDVERVGRHRAWIIDPLDGTREFSEPPRDDWAVHVALVIDGVAVVGAVALPARGLTLSTGAPPPTPPAHPGPPRLLVSRSRPTEHAERLARRLGAELVPMGSAGAKAMAVVLGDGDVYAHSGGQYEWDSAAPVAVAAAVGMHVSRLDGSPLVYNQPNPWLPDLLICRPDLAAPVIAICQEES